MKNLILLITVIMMSSCGKHEQPKYVDYQDDDGDQIPNYLEVSEVDKYVANFEQIIGSKAKIIIKLKKNDGDFKVLNGELDFKQDLRSKLNQVIVKNFEQREINYQSDYFSEFVKVKLSLNEASNNDISQFKVQESEIEIIFDNEKMNLDHLSLLKTKNGVFESFASAQINKNILTLRNISSIDIFNEILKSDSLFLSNSSRSNLKNSYFSNGVLQDIKLKTYRLIISKSEETNIYYVSQSLTIAQFLKMANIDFKDYQFKQEADDLNILTNESAFNKFLVLVNLKEDEMNTHRSPGTTSILFAGDIEEMKNDFLKNTLVENFSLKRIGGQGNQKRIVKSMDQYLVVDFNMSRTLNQFARNTETVRRSYPQSITCFTQKVNIVSHNVLNELHIENVNDYGVYFKLDDKDVSPTLDTIIIKDGQRIRRMIFKQPGQNLDIILNAQPVDTRVGCIESSCPFVGIAVNCKKQYSSAEAELSLNYSAYIE